MKNGTTALFSVVHPFSIGFLSDFIETVNQQTDPDFEVYLLVDGIDEPEVIPHRMQPTCHVRPATGSAAFLRKEGIRWIHEAGVENIVFLDSDDKMDADRIGAVRAKLDKYPVVANDLIFWTGSDQFSMFDAALGDKPNICAEDLRDKNFLGLSNTAIKTAKAVAHLDAIADDTIAFDWALFGLVLHHGAEGIFLGDTKSYYRQYTHNIASVLDLSRETVTRAVMVKSQQYQLLARYFPEYRGRWKQFKGTLEKLVSSTDRQIQYTEKINAKPRSSYFWWDYISPWSEVFDAEA